MVRPILNFFILFLLVFNCNAQTNPNPKFFYNDNFKWTIGIPEGFTNVSPASRELLQHKGHDAIENTFDDAALDESQIIFAFKNKDFNYFESNYEPYNKKINGDYIEYCHVYNQELYETFMSQMPNTAIQSKTGSEIIGGLKFQTFKIELTLPNGMIMHTKMYTRLFDKIEFQVNISYIDEAEGQKMLDSWLNSKFEN